MKDDLFENQPLKRRAGTFTSRTVLQQNIDDVEDLDLQDDNMQNTDDYDFSNANNNRFTEAYQLDYENLPKYDLEEEQLDMDQPLQE